MRTYAGLWAACAMLSGCAGGPFEWRYGPDKIVPGQFSIVGAKGSILTWPSHAVGAIIYPGTSKACIQSAQSAKARNSSGSGSLGIKAPQSPEIDLKLAQAITEAVTALQDKNDVATFADVSLFQICTIAANANLTQGEVQQLIQAVLTASVEIAKARPNMVRNTATVTGPDGKTSELKSEVTKAPVAEPGK